ncbi:hypothetical protein LYZ77_18520 [Xanthomonas hortorum pv. vitians]|uniref:hypothetical protein n=1 Tax=Xanthomonas hortorum TaxID=56454 RepID=UPI0012A9CFC3|nr:hypothetical protein [Xanthomonas hortorum]MCE4282750.1 hypothetical protein [Xanthomonas hortorum pv. vitians]MCE4286854.1 hypothetical protein [Xanthomonas hortorum pv. vitians]MCE4287972.1 hypothetical protein [Xanthomonas hortorum pv. vitians]MCE4295657.1 hypothetical protein [Xanthomonas hortorum pv. vitians]MDT7854270.1 hypothetical protein [Xanthomonas hortorum pv. vitians]
MTIRIIFLTAGLAAIFFPTLNIVMSLSVDKTFSLSDAAGIAAGIAAIASTFLGASKEKESVRHDREIFAKFLRDLPHKPSIQLLKDHDFGGDYYKSQVQHLFDFVREWDRPELEFLDKKIEKKRKSLYDAAHNLFEDFMRETVPNDHNPEMSTVYPGNQRGGSRPDSIKQSAATLNASARKFAPQYDEFVRYTRRRLSMES